MEARAFVESDACDVGCRVRLKDGTVEWVWVDGVRYSDPEVLTGAAYGKSGRREWERSVDEIADVLPMSAHQFQLQCSKTA